MTIDVARSVKKMFVDGKWTESESGQLFEATSPATGEVIAQVPKGTRADAKRAVEAAHRARSAMRCRRFERSKPFSAAIAAEDLKRLEGRVLPSASPSKLVLARHYPRGVY